MSRCNAAQAVEAFAWWLGYCEKATSKYASLRDRKYFETDKGSNNYTYAGSLCGVQGQPWCAAQVTTAVTEACGGSREDAKAVMHGLWPYVSCDQLYDAAPAAYKGRRGKWDPRAGDVIIFSSDGKTREHTGMVYAADDGYVYTMEGNSSNMCRKRAYALTGSYIWGYVRPAYADGGIAAETAELYGAVCCAEPELHELSKGTAGPEVKTIQSILYARGIRDGSGNEVRVDGDFGKATQAAVKTLQKMLGIRQDGIVGPETWTKALKELR